MKFICLGYYDEKRWEAAPERERQAMMDECFAYDEVLREKGHFAGGEGLQGTPAAKTLRWRNGRVSVTDGPFAEAKEVLGGILILEARDMDHAVELMSKHPGIRVGGFEIRPVDDMSQLVRESQVRRGKAAAG